MKNEKTKLLNKTSQGADKLWFYLTNLSKRNQFQQDILKIRKHFNIPEKGYKTKDKKLIFYPPEEFFKAHYPVRTLEFLDYLRKFCQKYNLYFLDWQATMICYVCYGKLKRIKNNVLEGSLCLFLDLYNESLEPFDKEVQNSLLENFPLAIRFSSCASLRDLKDFIKKAGAYIKTYQTQFNKEREINCKIATYKHKDKAKEKRNDYIYRLKQKGDKTKEIVNKIAEKFDEELDEGAISKIAWLEEHERTNI